MTKKSSHPNFSVSFFEFIDLCAPQVPILAFTQINTERKKPTHEDRLLLYHSYHSIVSGPVTRETYGKLQSVVIDG